MEPIYSLTCTRYELIEIMRASLKMISDLSKTPSIESDIERDRRERRVSEYTKIVEKITVILEGEE